MDVSPLTLAPNIISFPIPAAAVVQEPPPPSNIITSRPPQPSPSPPPIPAPPMDDFSPSPPPTPTPRGSSLRLSEDPSEDLTSLLGPDASMVNLNPLSPAPTTEDVDDQLTPPTLQRRPMVLSRSEGDISVPRPSACSSILARVEEDAAMRLLDANTTSRDPLHKYTRALMPQVHDASPTSVYDYINHAILATWDESPGEKVLVQPFDDFVTVPANHEFLRLRILSAVKEITDAQQIRVSVPLLLEEYKSPPHKYCTPTVFLICKLSETQKNILLDRYVWASSSIAFRVIRTDPPHPNFLFSVKGLGTTLEDDVRGMIQSVWHDSTTTLFLSSIVDATPLPDRRKVSSALRNLIDSLRIERLDVKERGDTLAPRFNIFADGSPIPDVNTWSKIRSFLAKRSYADILIGFGTTEIAPYKCTLCHGITHPRGLCPFPSVVGWNPPIYQVSNRSERGRGQGPRA